MPPQLATTGYAILGVLSFNRELSGYDVKKWADASLRFFYWSPALSQVYTELGRLERRGLVSSRNVPRDEVRDKRVFRITDLGREELTRWVEDAPVEMPVLKHSVVLRAWLGHLAEPEQLRSMLQQHIEQVEKLATEAAEDRTLAEQEPRWAYPELVLTWARDYYRAEAKLARAMLARLPADRVEHPA
jgi:DNA-binding PadR family transcriptional regulator